MGDHWRAERVERGGELAFAHAVMRHFHEDASDEEARRLLPLLEGDDYRAWVVRDGSAIVGNYGAYTMTLSLPGGKALAAAGVTAVGVAQTHRRRGLLRTMMTAGLDEAVERGEAAALLFASESPIYGRFGFGVAVPTARHRIDRGTAFRAPVDPRLVEAATPQEALASWPAVFERLRTQRGGVVSRPDAVWRLAFVDDPPSKRGGASGRRLAHVPGRGYVAYRVKEADDPSLLPEGEVLVLELVATDAEAEAALWQHVCDIDLTTRVDAWYRPPDDALVQLLVDPLRARTSVGPPLYARLLDVPAALAARSYATEGEITVAVDDATRDQSGTFRLRAHPDGGEVRRVTTAPDLSMPVDALASVWLGGVRATQLLAARRIEEHAAGAAARLDRLTAVDRLPWQPFEF